MTLTLKITASSGTKPAETRHVFTEAGGIIGRAGGNSWVLPHNKVSAKHALISFRNGVFYIQDKSRNGTSVNSPENRLVADRPYALKAGTGFSSNLTRSRWRSRTPIGLPGSRWSMSLTRIPLRRWMDRPSTGRAWARRPTAPSAAMSIRCSSSIRYTTGARTP